MDFVCPICKGALQLPAGVYVCSSCDRRFPVILGIPDFRIYPDPYISIEADRLKGIRLHEACRGRRFSEALAFYYSITPEVPPDRAARWTARSLAQRRISGFILQQAGLTRGGHLLDVGCSTGGLLAAAAGRFRTVTGVDVAFRWLVAGQLQLRELGIQATLVCANAEALPFPAGSFDAVTLLDLIEHTRDAETTVSEARRVLAPGGRTLCTSNNRYAPVADPHVGVWGVGYLPRKWQAAYIALRRRGMHRYRVRVRSARELDSLFRGAGFGQYSVVPAPLCAPHLSGAAMQRLLNVYNRLRGWRWLAAPLKLIAPEIGIVAQK